VDRQIAELRDCFPWGDINGTVVDVGGGSGHISMALARVSFSFLASAMILNHFIS
jgi:tRNA A58 N-methylase Trm61